MTEKVEETKPPTRSRLCTHLLCHTMIVFQSTMNQQSRDPGYATVSNGVKVHYRSVNNQLSRHQIQTMYIPSVNCPHHVPKSFKVLIFILHPLSPSRAGAGTWRLRGYLAGISDRAGIDRKFKYKFKFKVSSNTRSRTQENIWA